MNGDVRTSSVIARLRRDPESIIFPDPVSPDPTPDPMLTFIPVIGSDPDPTDSSPDAISEPDAIPDADPTSDPGTAPDPGSIPDPDAMSGGS